VSARVAAANRLESVASVLGEQRTREELLPFLTDGVDDEDEVLLALANSLGKLVQLVGGGNYAEILLPPIELLLTVEENSVLMQPQQAHFWLHRLCPILCFRTSILLC